MLVWWVVWGYTNSLTVRLLVAGVGFLLLAGGISVGIGLRFVHVVVVVVGFVWRWWLLLLWLLGCQSLFLLLLSDPLGGGQLSLQVILVGPNEMAHVTAAVKGIGLLVDVVVQVEQVRPQVTDHGEQRLFGSKTS